MANWFKWPRSTKAHPAPNPIRHICGCGWVSDVIRGDQFQRLSCSNCGEDGFLLPRDVYPGDGPIAAVPERASEGEPGISHARQVAQPGGRAKSTSVPPSRDEDRPASRLTSKSTSKSTAKSTARSTARSATVDTDAAVAGSLSESRGPLVTRHGIQEVSNRAPRRRRITPFRLVSVCMMLLVGGTVWWSVREFQFSNMAGQLGELTRSGLESFESGDFKAAARDLGLAAGVLDRLGRTDSTAKLIRQRSREAAAADGLIGESLVEILGRVDRLKHDGATKTWERQFERDHQGAWIVMQSVLERRCDGVKTSNEPDGGRRGETSTGLVGSGGFELEYPLLLQDRQVRLRGRLAALDRLPGWADSSDDPRPVIFAAQLEACRFESSTDTWWVELTPETAFLWTDIGSIRHLGFSPDATLGDGGISEILDRQATAAGLEPGSFAVGSASGTARADERHAEGNGGEVSR